MATYADTTALARRELDECRELLARAPEWDVPTVCEGWDVDALARHVASVAWQQAEAFHRARILVTEAPSWLQIAGDRDAVLAALDEDRTHLVTRSLAQSTSSAPSRCRSRRSPHRSRRPRSCSSTACNRADTAADDRRVSARRHARSEVASVSRRCCGIVPLLAQKDPVTR